MKSRCGARLRRLSSVLPLLFAACGGGPAPDGGKYNVKPGGIGEIASVEARRNQ